MQHRALSIAAAMSIVVLLSSPAAVAQLPVPPVGAPMGPPAPGAPIKSFAVVPFLDLLEITAAELLGGAGAARDAGTTQPLVGIGLVADLGDPVNGSMPETSVRREVEYVWEAWVHKNDLDGLQVDMELTSADGTPDELSSIDSAASRMLVDTWPLPPVIIEQDGAWNLLRGGVRMDLDLAQATVAGSYRGSLLVVLNNL